MLRWPLLINRQFMTQASGGLQVIEVPTQVATLRWRLRDGLLVAERRMAWVAPRRRVSAVPAYLDFLPFLRALGLPARTFAAGFNWPVKAVGGIRNFDIFASSGSSSPTWSSK